MKEYNFYCDVSLAKTYGLYQRIMGVKEDHGSTRGGLGVSEDHGNITGSWE
jgi:hypothetical protein